MKFRKRGNHLDKLETPQHYATNLLHKEHESMLHSDGAHLYKPSQIDGQENVEPSQPQGAIFLASNNGHYVSNNKGLEVHAWKGSGPFGHGTSSHSCNSYMISPIAGRLGLC
jgi:hypothetical protein